MGGDQVLRRAQVDCCLGRELLSLGLGCSGGAVGCPRKSSRSVRSRSSTQGVGSQPAGGWMEAAWGRPFGELGGDIGFGGDGRKGLGGEASG